MLHLNLTFFAIFLISWHVLEMDQNHVTVKINYIDNLGISETKIDFSSYLYNNATTIVFLYLSEQ